MLVFSFVFVILFLFFLFLWGTNLIVRPHRYGLGRPMGGMLYKQLLKLSLFLAENKRINTTILKKEENKVNLEEN